MSDALECVGEEAGDGEVGVDAFVADDRTGDGGDDGAGEGGGVAGSSTAHGSAIWPERSKRSS